MGVPTLSLEHNIAIVTGSRRGIGRAIAIRFAQAGADVAVCDLVAGSELDTVAEEIERIGQRSLRMQVDIRDKIAVNNCVQKVEDKLGDITILVNVAGVLHLGPLVELPEEEWDTVLDTNLKGYYLMCQAVGKRMIKRRKGNIINLASTDSFIATPHEAAYCCSKAGVRMLTSVLAFELGIYDIRVNAIAPGWARTEMITPLGNYESDPDSISSMALAEVALGHIGEPIDLANAALFLASDLASYISGVTLRVDGAMNPAPLAANMPEIKKR